MANFDAQLQRMKSLMTYGAVKENKKQTCGAMEYHAIGADGKAYGIIRENQKFYIKTADKKNETVVEAYNYIGGFNNKKQYEYAGLSEAKKNFDMKLKSIKESYKVKVTSDLDKFSILSEDMSICGKNMMNEIARQRQIMANAAAIMNESSTIGASNTGNPEAPKTTSFEPKAGPFTETASAELDKDFNKTSSDPKKEGEPFGDNSKTEQPKDAEYVPQGSVANQKPKGGKVVKVDEATMKVWEIMSKLDKSFNINECGDWGSCGVPSNPGVGSAEGHLMEEEMPMEEPMMESDEIAGMPDEEATEFADGEFEGAEDVESDVESEEMPEDEEDDFDFEMFDDEEGEDEDDEDMEDELDSEEDGEDAAEEDMENPETDDVDELKLKIAELEAKIAELTGEGNDDDFESDDEMEFEVEPNMDDEFEMGDEEEFEEEMPEEEMEETFDPEVANYDDEFDEEFCSDEDGDFCMSDEYVEDEEDFIPESRKQELNPLVESFVKSIINEEKLNDFGKHPGYRKKPMTLPATGSDEGDWNDESVYSEQPFGQKIGSGAPYEKVVNAVTDVVMEIFKKKI